MDGFSWFTRKPSDEEYVSVCSLPGEILVNHANGEVAISIGFDPSNAFFVALEREFTERSNGSVQQ